MPSKTSFALGVAIPCALLACVTGAGGSVFAGPEGGADGGPNGGLDPRFTFSPRDAERACERDDDCVILPSLANCSSCCGHGAVARGEAERAHAAVVAACGEPDAPPGSVCGMYCGAFRPACFEGTCVRLPDPKAGGFPPAPVCASDGGAADGGTAAPEPGPGPSCGARAVATGFEDGIDPSWRATDPAAFRIARDEPLAGAASLRIAYRQKNAYLTIEQPDACAIRIAFTLRTRLVASGLTLARIVAGAGSWFHVRLDGCALSVAEEMRSDGAAGMGFGGQTWPVPDDVPVRVLLTFDLRAKTLATAVAPLGEPLPEPKTTTLRGDPSGAGAIRAVELGSAPGVESPAVGAVWIDDLVID